LVKGLTVATRNENDFDGTGVAIGERYCARGRGERAGAFIGGWKLARFSRRVMREGGTDMGRTEIVERIRARAEAVKALGATALYICGSRARGDEQPDSDLDVFVDFDPEKFGFVELVELEDTLSCELGLNVQLRYP
jgi:predicted nucleotidyltransferase